ncbi:hypothetical protein Tco_0469382 [Tanacetum coccineum]
MYNSQQYDSNRKLGDLEQKDTNFGLMNAQNAPNKEDDVDISRTHPKTETELLIPDDIKPGIMNPKIGDDIEFEINANFMRELRRKLFAGTNNEDTYEHVHTVLEIVDLSTSLASLTMPLCLGFFELHSRDEP